MVADFRQFYGIDLPIEPTDEDCSRWALLWYALPRESRTARRQSPELRWSEAEYMLAMAVYALDVIKWQRTKDGQHNPTDQSRCALPPSGPTRSAAATARSPRAKR